MSRYKRYPKYKDSGVEWIGGVPDHWAVGRLRDFTRTISTGPFGTALGNDDYIENGVPVINPSHISGDRCVPDSRVSVSQEKAQALSFWSMHPGDVVTARRGELGRSAVIEPAQDGWICGTGSIRIIPKTGRVASQYIHATLQTECARSWLEQQSVGSTMPNLSEKLISNLPVVVPPTIGEQEVVLRRTADEAARIDALIAKKTRFIELLKEKRQAFITHAVTKGLDPKVKLKDSEVEWVGEVPEPWEVVQIRHVAALGSGHTPSRSRPDWWEHCHVPWFTLADVWQLRYHDKRYVLDTAEKISHLGVKNSSAVVHPAGAVILSRTASVGFAAIMGCDMATSQDFGVWRCGPRILNLFLYFVLRGMRGELNRLMIGSTHKTIYMPDIEALRMPLPPRKEQEDIVDRIDRQTTRINKLIEKTKRSVILLRERRSAFITAAVTGQIDLREVSA